MDKVPFKPYHFNPDYCLCILNFDLIPAKKHIKTKNVDIVMFKALFAFYIFMRIARSFGSLFFLNRIYKDSK